MPLPIKARRTKNNAFLEMVCINKEPQPRFFTLIIILILYKTISLRGLHPRNPLGLRPSPTLSSNNKPLTEALLRLPSQEPQEPFIEFLTGSSPTMKFHIKFVGLVSSVLVLLGSSEGASDCASMDESQFSDLASLQGLDYKNPNVTFKCEAGAWNVHNPTLRTRASGLVTFATQGVCKDSSGFRSCWNYGGYVYNDRNKYTNTAKYFFAQNVYQREEAFDGKGETCTSDGAFCFDMINGMCFWSYMNQKWSKYCYELPLLTFDV